MLKILLLLFILYILINNIKKYESFINNTQAKYSYFYNNYFIDKSKYENILLLGFVTDETKIYFETNFSNTNISIINVEPIQYSSTTSKNTKIYENQSPYDPNLIEQLKDNNNIYDIIILEGEIIIEKIILACKSLDILKDTGVFIIQMDSINTAYTRDISLIKNVGLANIKNTIKIFDYSKNTNNNNMGIVISIDKNT